MTNKKNTKTASYQRVPSELRKDEDHTRENQEANCRDYALSKGLKPIKQVTR